MENLINIGFYQRALVDAILDLDHASTASIKIYPLSVEWEIEEGTSVSFNLSTGEVVRKNGYPTFIQLKLIEHVAQKSVRVELTENGKTAKEEYEQ